MGSSGKGGGWMRVGGGILQLALVTSGVQYMSSGFGSFFMRDIVHGCREVGR